MRVQLSKSRRRSTKRPLVIALTLILIALSATLVLYRSRSNNQPQPAQQRVQCPEGNKAIKQPRIGLLIPLSGPFGQEGKMFQLGIELAWEELQDQGVKAELVVRDTGRDFSEAAQMANRMTCDPNMLLVIAHLPTTVVNEVMPSYEKAKLLMLDPAGSHQNLVGRSWLLPLVSSDREEAAWAARIVHKWTADKSAAVLYDDDPYANVLYQGFETEAEKIKLNVLPFACQEKDSSIEEVTSKLLKENPAAIWLAGTPTWGTKVVKALLQKQYKGRFLAPQSYGDPFLENLFGKYPENFFILRPGLVTDQGNGAMQDFCKTFRSNYWRDPSWLSVLGYDTMRWVGKALQQGPLSRMAVRDHFLQYNSPKHAFQGLGGPVFFDENRQVQRPFHVAVYRNGRLQPAPGL